MEKARNIQKYLMQLRHANKLTHIDIYQQQQNDDYLCAMAPRRASTMPRGFMLVSLPALCISHKSATVPCDASNSVRKNEGIVRRKIKKKKENRVSM